MPNYFQRGMFLTDQQWLLELRTNAGNRVRHHSLGPCLLGNLEKPKGRACDHYKQVLTVTVR